jgi:hypothetical protein
MSRGARGIAVLAAVSCTALASAAGAGAATVYVSNSAPTVPGGKTCAQPAYSTVQAAITAAGDGTVEICPGTYVEQISIAGPVKLNAVSGIGTATLAMPADAALSKSGCDTLDGLEQIDEISICTSQTVTMTGLDVQAVIPLETCAYGLNGIFVGDGGTLSANSIAVDGASTSLDNYKGCQHGIAIEVGSKTPAEVGHAKLKNVTVSGYEKNGPTVKSPGSTMSITGSTITGEGPSPYIAQNGIEVAWGGQATIKSSHVSGNECSIPVVCEAVAEQATGVLFYEAAPGSSLSSSTIEGNDIGAYYGSGRKTVAATPEVSISKDLLSSNRYEGILLEEGKASLRGDTINGSGRVGVDLYQAAGQLSASESSASGLKISGQSEAAFEVESDKSPSDVAGKFTITKDTASGNGSVLIDDSDNFEVIF